MNYDLEMIESSNAKIKGVDLAVESKVTGEIFMTTKKYMDKLFSNAGYRSTGVIKILEEFAGKYVSEVGLTNVNIYKNDATTFIVCSPECIVNYKSFLKYLNGNSDFTKDFRKLTEYIIDDQMIIHNKKTNSDFVLYINFLDENIKCYSLDFDGKVLVGMTDEGDFSLKDSTGIAELIPLLNSPINNKYMFDMKKQISTQEYVDLLDILSIVNYKRGKKIYSVEDSYPNIDDIVSDFNEKSEIQRRIKENIDKKNFRDICELISEHLDDLFLFRVAKFYINNSKDKLDFDELNR